MGRGAGMPQQQRIHQQKGGQLRGESGGTEGLGGHGKDFGFYVNMLGNPWRVLSWAGALSDSGFGGLRLAVV